MVSAKIFLGSGTFSTCHLTLYREILVAVKEFKSRQSRSDKEVKHKVLNEAQMISHFCDHRGLPLLFGVITKSTPFCLLTQFHGNKIQSLKLYKAMKRLELDKPYWLHNLRGIIEALSHVHSKDILDNDLKSNNVLLQKCGKDWNPVIIDFGKACFISNLKTLASLSVSAQEQYLHSYSQITLEIVCGEGWQSVQLDVFSVGRIALAILLPTATALSLKAGKQDIIDNPVKWPSLENFCCTIDTSFRFFLFSWETRY